MQENIPTALLVTGGAGYIGSCLIREITTYPCLSGMLIRVLDNMQREGYAALMDLPASGRYEFIEGDILDPITVRRALEGIDAVVHLAAIVRTPFSFDHPAWTKQVNHWGTARLVEQCLEASITRFIFASSASVYGPGGFFNEEDICHPIGPYSESKRRAEEVVLAAAERGLRPTVLRLATAFGYAPTMRFDAVANHFSYLCGVGRPLTIYGTGEQQRPLVHVRDASRAICFCLAQAQKTEKEIFNAVSRNASVLDVAENVRQIRPDTRIHYTEQDEFTQLSFTVNGQKLTSRGWSPRYNIRDGITEIVNRFSYINPLSMGFDHSLETF